VYYAISQPLFVNILVGLKVYKPLSPNLKTKLNDKIFLSKFFILILALILP